MALDCPRVNASPDRVSCASVLASIRACADLPAPSVQLEDGRAAVALGNEAIISDASNEARENCYRRAAWRSRGRASRLVRSRGPVSVGYRVGSCGCAGRGPQGDKVVQLMRRPDGRSYYSGTLHCSLRYACAVCGGMIAEENRLDMESVFKLARDRGFLPYMVSLTVRHDASMPLKGFLAAMRKARSAGLGADAYAWVIEITHGFRNGWHPHYHGIFFLRSEESLPLLEAIRSEWSRCCLNAGLDGSHSRAFDCRGAANAGEYLSKSSFVASAELSLSNRKSGRAGDGSPNRTPWKLLDDCFEGRSDSIRSACRSAWFEYLDATKGLRQIQGSQGFGRLKLEALAAFPPDASAEASPGPDTVAFQFSPYHWNEDVRFKALHLLECSESAVSLSAAQSSIRAALAGPLVDADFLYRNRDPPVFEEST